MVNKKDNKLVASRKTTVTAKPEIKSPDKEKNPSMLIKMAETVGGVLGKIAGTAHNNMTSKRNTPVSVDDHVSEITQESPKQVRAKKPAQLAAKSKTPKKIKVLKAKE